MNLRARITAALLACTLAGCSTQYADPVRAAGGAGGGAGGTGGDAGGDSGSGTDPCSRWGSETECVKDTANGCSVQPNEVGCLLDDASCVAWACASGDPFVSRSGPDLFLKGRPFRFVGANAWGVAGRNGNCQYSGFPSQREALPQVFGALAEMRVQVLRVWAFQSFCGASGTDYSALDQVVRYARSAGVRLIFVLENMHDDCSQGKRDDSWFQAGYREPYGNYALSFPDYTRGVVTHFRDEPTVLAWEIMHEAGGNDPAAMLDFATKMTALVRSNDMNHRIILGTDNGNTPATQIDGSPSPYTTLQALDTVDLVDTHDFFAENSALTAAEQASCAVAQSLHKPCFVGASAVSLIDTSASSFSARASQVSNKAQAALDAGFAGYLVYAFTPGWQTVGFDFDARATEPLVGPGGTLATFAAQLRDP
ncbi:MAG TPA: cellulase family glycosylhydrolase [Polyangiaceae bacterium]|nr:cellulase family glycosylhydrolase [Polyangiaceae bacterium]